MKRVVSIVFFTLLGVLLLNNGLELGVSEHLMKLCRIVAGASAIVLAIMEF